VRRVLTYRRALVGYAVLVFNRNLQLIGKGELNVAERITGRPLHRTLRDQQQMATCNTLPRIGPVGCAIVDKPGIRNFGIRV